MVGLPYFLSRMTLRPDGRMLPLMADRVARSFFQARRDQPSRFHAASPPEMASSLGGPAERPADRARKSSEQCARRNWTSCLVPIDPPEFMEREIRKNDYILIIYVPKYKAKSDNRAGGLGYEWLIIAEVFAKQNHRIFIPVLASGRWAESSPFLVVLKAIVSFCPLTGPAKDFIASNPRAKFQRNRSSMSPTTMCSARSKRELRALQSLQGTS
jgi:hypothetical protein